MITRLEWFHPVNGTKIEIIQAVEIYNNYALYGDKLIDNNQVSFSIQNLCAEAPRYMIA